MESNLEDAELLRRYAGNRDEDAFAELVRRHLGLVYHAALRQCGGDAHRAEDVAQAVFTDLARKAAKLARRPALAGWLYTSTRYAASQAVRGEARRQARELEAHAMNEILSGPNAGPAAEWERLRPVIDDALHALGERDREAVLLRFFEGRAFADVGAKLFLSEDAARMRVERALEKLRAALVRRGITSTTAALGVALANQAAATAPAGVAASVTGAALAGAASASGAASAAAILMSMTKLQAGIISALAVAGVTGFGLQAQSNAALRDEIARLQQESPVIAPLRAENRRLARTAAEIVELRKDDAVLAQLRDEARELKDRLQAVMHAAKTADTGVTPTPLTGEVFDVKKIDRPPKPAFQARPVYPTEMRKAATSGEVTVDFIVDAAGMVHNVVAIKSSQREFEASAVEAVSHWEFEPGQKDGRAVNTHMMTRIVFTWEKKAAAPDTGQPKTENNKPAPAPWF